MTALVWLWLAGIFPLATVAAVRPHRISREAHILIFVVLIMAWIWWGALVVLPSVSDIS
jgi:hypothetical protein